MTRPESTTEPIICCIGVDVAGRPTQFVLQRAFEAEGMHWQVLTVEVLAEKLPLIIDATLAMGFRGLRFYGELEPEAGRLLSRPGSLEHLVGNVTSAINSGESWQIWDNRGPAWLKALENDRQPHELTSLWLHGDSLQTRSLFAAIIAEADSSRWVWSNAPECLNGIEDLRIQSAIAEGRVLFSQSPTLSQFQEWLGCDSLDAFEESQIPQTRLAVVTADTGLPDQIASCLSQWRVQLFVPHQLKLTPPLSDRVRRRLSEADIAVAAKAYDFFRWTGRETDLGLLRDAYDEYCDF